MSDLTVAFARMFGELFVPKDTMYRQAKDLIARNDVDGDGVINLGDNAQWQHMSPFGRQTFAYADSLGMQNGVVSVRELRNGLQRYDIDGNNAVVGQELVTAVQDVLKFVVP